MTRPSKLGPSPQDIKMFTFTEGHLKHLEYAFPRVPVTPTMTKEAIMYNAGVQAVLDYVKEKGIG